MYIVPIFTILLALTQQHEIQTHPEDPLHHFVVFEVSEEPVTTEVKVEHEGYLHVWASSTDIDPRLSIAHDDEEEVLEDDNSGGGTTAYLKFSVHAGEVVKLTVVNSTPEEKGDEVELHWVTSVETDTTRSLTIDTIVRIKEAESLVTKGDLESARNVIGHALSKIMELECANLSEEIANAALILATTASQLKATRTTCAAVKIRCDHHVRTLPASHPNLLLAKNSLASTLREMGDFEEARTLFKAMLEVQVLILPRDHPDLLRTMNNLAVTMEDMGDLKDARALEEAVLEATIRTLPEDHPLILTSKQTLASTLYDMNDYKSAYTLFKEVLEARCRTLPENNLDLLFAKGNLANTLNALGDYETAQVLQKTVLEAFSHIYPEDHPTLLQAKHQLASTLRRKGDLISAYTLYKEVLVVMSRILPTDHPRLLSVKKGLACTIDTMGDHAGASSLWAAMLEVLNRTLPNNHSDLLETKMFLADSLFGLGDHTAARALREEVLEALIPILPEDHPEVLISKQRLAFSMKVMDDYEGARKLEEEVLEIRNRAPEDRLGLIYAKGNLANTMNSMGDYEGAHTVMEEVQSALSLLLPEGHPYLFEAKSILAVIKTNMGDYSGARPLQEETLKYRKRTLPKDHPDLLQAKGNLAWTMFEMGEINSARKLAHELVENQLTRLSWALASLSRREAREIVSSELSRQSGIRFLTSFENSALSRSLRFNLAETLRSTTNLDLGSDLKSDTMIIDLRKQIASARARIGDLMGLVSTNNNIEESLAQMVRERDGLERKLRQRLTETNSYVNAIRSEDVALVLPEGAVAIGFLVTEAWGVNANPTRIVSRGNILTAHMLRQDGFLFEVELGPAEELVALAAAWRGSLGEPIGRGTIRKKSREALDEQSAGETLRSRLLDPLLSQLGDETNTLLICVDDFVHTIPLDALPLNEGYVGDYVEIIYLPSFRRLVSPRPPLDTTEKPRLLAIGGINFDAKEEAHTSEILSTRSAAIEAGERNGGDPTSFLPLLHTGMESRAVSILFENTFDHEGALLHGTEATKLAFARLAPGSRYLHIATHGWFAPMQFPESSVDELAFSHFSPEERVSKLSPMILCGLALAGANSGRNELGRVPGILTAEELSGIDLSACDLAVLSACETNVGIRSAGVGIQSLKAALHAAGVRTAITSLWQVDDAATRKLMELFYTYLWMDKIPKAKALWKAKQVLRDEGHPVRDWAAWVLSGDPN